MIPRIWCTKRKVMLKEAVNQNYGTSAKFVSAFSKSSLMYRWATPPNRRWASSATVRKLSRDLVTVPRGFVKAHLLRKVRSHTGKGRITLKIDWPGKYPVYPGVTSSRVSLGYDVLDGPEPKQEAIVAMARIRRTRKRESQNAIVSSLIWLKIISIRSMNHDHSASCDEMDQCLEPRRSLRHKESVSSVRVAYDADIPRLGPPLLRAV